MTRIAGIDFGKARIGIALSDERQLLASPLITLTTAPKSNLPAQVESVYSALIHYFPLKVIVIGLPLHLNGKESPMSTLVREFAKIVEERFLLPVILWDERLSTAQVERVLKDANMRRKKRTAHLDRMSAALILQNYLDSI
jgi:putative holliday junction resolvase